MSDFNRYIVEAEVTIGGRTEEVSASISAVRLTTAISTFGNTLNSLPTQIDVEITSAEKRDD